MNTNKDKIINKHRQAIAGVQKHFANTPTLVLGGTPTRHGGCRFFVKCLISHREQALSHARRGFISRMKGFLTRMKRMSAPDGGFILADGRLIAGIRRFILADERPIPRDGRFILMGKRSVRVRVRSLVPRDHLPTLRKLVHRVARGLACPRGESREGESDNLARGGRPAQRALSSSS